MPIANPIYAKYYNSHKDAIHEKLKTKYEGGGNEKKKEYYTQHKDEIKAKVIQRYQEKKAVKNEDRLKFLINNNLIPNEVKKIEAQQHLDTGTYRTLSKKIIDSFLI
jgi:hypothetical protein